MKKIKALALLGLLGLSSLLVQAQTYTKDISTGKDYYGNRMANLSIDDTWKLKAPGSSSYNPVRVGTGLYRPSAETYYAVASKGITVPNSSYPNCDVYPIGWLTPSTYFTTNAQNLEYAGDIKPTVSGTYKYKTAVFIPDVACKGIAAAEIVVNRLAAADRVTRLFVNGNEYDLNDYVDPINSLAAWDIAAYGGLNYTDFDPGNGDYFSCAYFNSSWGPVPQPYTITLDPDHLVIGTNTIEVYCEVEPNQSMPGYPKPSGFMCDAQFNYTLTDQPVCLSLAGTTNVACVGDVASIHFTVNSAASYPFKIELFQVVNGVSTLVGNLPAPNPTNPTNPYIFTSPSSLQTIVYHVIPANNATTYKVRITDMSDPSVFIFERPVRLRLCRMVPYIDFLPYSISSTHFSVMTNPYYDDETDLGGFKSKWTLEELDATTMEPIYIINDPQIWQNQHSAFEGFKADLSADYKAIGNVTSMPSTGEPGVFSNQSVYRITRYAKTDEMADWESYSVVFDPSTDVFGKNEATTGIQDTEANHSGFSVFPNPGKGQFFFTSETTGIVRILDISGKKVQEFVMIENKTVDLSSLKNGIYFLNFETDKGTTTQKLVIE